MRRLSSSLVFVNTGTVLPELAAVGCFLAVLWAGIYAGLDHEYANAEQAAMQSTSNLARAFEESTRRAIGQIDQTLLSARAFYLEQGSQFDFTEWVRTQTLNDSMTAAVGMADDKGRVFADTLPIVQGVNIADRPHFQAQIDPAQDRLFISRPVNGRVSGQETIQFTRKLLSKDGKFAGVAVVSLGCTELSRFYETLDLGQGFISLLLTDGTILARGPRVAGSIGASIDKRPELSDVLRNSVGTVAFQSTRTHAGRIVSFRHLQDYPVIVMVGLETDTVFREYRSLRTRLILSGVAVTLSVGLIGVLWGRQKQRSVASRRALTVTLDTISQGILMIDERGRVPVINPRALALLRQPDEPPEQTLEFAASRAMTLAASNPAAAPATDATDGGDPGQPGHESQFESTRDDGTILDVRIHTLADGGFVHTYTDVTRQRAADAKVRYLAHFDSLTGLANRVQLRQYMSDVLSQQASPDRIIAFLMIDLDGFKGINDSLGHNAGDELLIEVARRLQALAREADIVARLGGDEFVIMLAGIRQTADVALFAERVLRRLADPGEIGGHTIRIGASVGIAFYPQDGQDPDILLKHADIALYSAKTAGRGTYRCFDVALIHTVNERRLLESDLRRAIAEEEMEVHFQPKFNCHSLEIVGFEALARWRHPTRGFVSPAVFIQIAEECGLIGQLGLWILRRACASVAGWKVRLPVAVNASVVQLRAGCLQDDIAVILKDTGLPAGFLELEVTESVMVDDSETVFETLHAVKDMGIHIALDDFGTGYSSLSYLRRFSFDKIKIDKSFVQAPASDQGVRVILESILGMCRKLGLATVGEGVETQQQLELLQAFGCTEVQGYLLGRAMPNDLVEEFIEKRGGLNGKVHAVGPATKGTRLAS